MRESMASLQYFSAVHRLLYLIGETQGDNILAAADLMSECIALGGVVHVFGSGHSHIVAEEAFHRAGGLASMNPLLDPNLTSFGLLSASTLERMEGYAKVLLTSYGVLPGEVIIVASNSGVNALPIEVAIEGRGLGAKVVAITSAKAYADIPSRHSSSSKLVDIADVVIDNHVPAGDAVVDIEERYLVGPVSTVLSTAILNATVARTAERLAARDRSATPKVSICRKVDYTTNASSICTEDAFAF